MKPKSKRPLSRRCSHCGQPFNVNPRVGKLHRYCSAPACTKVRMIKYNAIWLAKMAEEDDGKSFFSGSEHCTRVRNWRKQNPHYWRRLKRSKRRKRPQFVLTKYRLSLLRFEALQATFDTLVALGNELVANVPAIAFQVSMAKKLRKAKLRGREILRNITEESIH